MSITYSSTRLITAEDFISVLRRSTLAERRPVEDRARIEAMLAGANLVCTAWQDELLVGVARCLTDFSYCCYLSDLAVDRGYQRSGVGRALIAKVQERLHPEAKIILLAAPAAQAYYPHIGMEQHPSAWLLRAGQALPKAKE